MKKKFFIGELTLTRKQMDRMPEVLDETYLDIYAVGKKFYCYSNADLSTDQLETVKARLQALSDEDTENDKEKIFFSQSGFKNLTISDIDNFVDSRATDAAGVRTILKIYGKILLAIAKRILSK